MICSFLKTAGGQGDVSKSLYLAMYYYRTCRFREALGVTAAVKSILIQLYLLFIDRADPEKYNEYVSGWSLFRRMKKAWANFIGLCSHTYNILELCFEQNLCKENGIVYLYISPYVLAECVM